MIGGGELRCLVLGPVAVNDASTGEQRPATGQAGAVLSMLAASFPRPVSSTRLIETIWADKAPATAETGIRVAVSRARDLLRGSGTENPITAESEHYSLLLPSESIDLFRFAAWVNEARVELSRANPDAAVKRLRDALQLWRGAPFGRWGSTESLLIEVAQLEQTRRDAEELFVDALLAARQGAEAILTAERLVESEPYRERRWMQLMLAMYREGRQSDALHAYQRAAARLGHDLGIMPSPEMVALEHDILIQAPHLSPTSPAASLPVSDLGALSDALHRTRIAPPRPGTSFVGRDDSLDEIRILQASHRMVTLVGPGGVGKTRLAAEFAHQHHVAVIFVPLAAVSEEDLVVALAERVGVGERPGTELVETLTEQLRSLEALIVLDNCEHLVAGTSRLAQVLIDSCPGISILATSRHRLGNESERLLKVEPLSIESARTMLFDRAIQHTGEAELAYFDTESVDALIACVDRLPLAIELAASQLDAQSPAQLVQALRHDLTSIGSASRVSDRHRDLTSLVQWSFDLLGHREQMLLIDLGVFETEFLAADAGAVAGCPEAEVGAGLRQLVRHSLLNVRTEARSVRYSIGEVVRLFTRDVVTPARRFESSQRHLRHFCQLAEGLEHELNSPREPQAVARLMPALGEIRSAIRHATESGDVDQAIRLTLSVFSSCTFRMNFDLLDGGAEIAELPGAENSRYYPELLGNMARFEWGRSDADRVLDYTARSIAASHRLGVGESITAHLALTAVAGYQGKLEASIQHLDQVTRLAQERGEPFWIVNAHVVAAIGAAVFGLGDIARSEGRKAVRAAEISGAPSVLAWALCGSGMSLVSDRPAQALPLFEEGVERARAVDNLVIVGMNLSGLVTSLRGLGRTDEARPLIKELLLMWSRGNRPAQLCDALVEAALVLASSDRRLASEAVRAADSMRMGYPFFVRDTAALEDLRSVRLGPVDRIWTEARTNGVIDRLVAALG